MAEKSAFFTNKNDNGRSWLWLRPRFKPRRGSECGETLVERLWCLKVWLVWLVWLSCISRWEKLHISSSPCPQWSRRQRFRLGLHNPCSWHPHPLPYHQHNHCVAITISTLLRVFATTFQLKFCSFCRVFINIIVVSFRYDQFINSSNVNQSSKLAEGELDALDVQIWIPKAVAVGGFALSLLSICVSLVFVKGVAQDQPVTKRIICLSSLRKSRIAAVGNKK